MSAGFLPRFIAAVASAAQELGIGGAEALPENIVFELFDSMPRQVRIHILLLFSAQEVMQSFCYVSRKYRRLYCGDMALADEIPDSQVVYEHWQEYLLRDFGVSRNPSLCRGDVPLERKMIAEALESIVPTNQRLNAYLAHAYNALYGAMVNLPRRMIPGGHLLARRDNIAFILQRGPNSGVTRAFEETVVLTTTLNIAYAQMQSSPIVQGYALVSGVNNVGNYWVDSARGHAGAYVISENGFEGNQMQIVRFSENTVDVSVPVKHHGYHRPLIYADPFDSTKTYVLKRDLGEDNAPSITTLYQLTSPPSDPGPLRIRQDLPATVISEQTHSGTDDGSLALSVGRIRLQITGTSAKIIPSVGSKYELTLPRIIMAFGGAVSPVFSLSDVGVVPNSARTDLRIVLQSTLRTNRKIHVLLLSLEFEPDTSRLRQATIHHFLLPREVDRLIYQIEDGHIYVAQLHLHTDTLPGSSVWIRIDLRTNTMQVLMSKDSLIDEAMASIQRTSERFKPLSDSSPDWARDIDTDAGEQLDVRTTPNN